MMGNNGWQICFRNQRQVSLYIIFQIPKSISSHSIIITMKNLNSPRFNTGQRLSIKKWRNRMRSQQSEKSTFCFTSNQGSTKTSIKELLTMKRTRNHESQNFMCLKYEDIKSQVVKQEKNFLNKILCGLKNIQNEDEGCECDPKCWLMQMWFEKAHKFRMKTGTKHQAETLPSTTEEQIKKDIPRTQPESQSFKIPFFLETLRQTLSEYALSDPEVGYVQGMNIIASVLVYHSRNMNQIKTVFDYIMKTAHFRDIYLKNFKLAYRIAQSVEQTLKYRCHDLYLHLVQNLLKQVDNLSTSLNAFVVGWLFPMLGNIVPLEKMHLVINTFIEYGWDGLSRILVVLFILLKKQLMGMFEEIQILSVMTVHNLRKMDIDWDQLIGSIQNIKLFYNMEKSSQKQQPILEKPKQQPPHKILLNQPTKTIETQQQQTSTKNLNNIRFISNINLPHRQQRASQRNEVRGMQRLSNGPNLNQITYISAKSHQTSYGFFHK